MDEYTPCKVSIHAPLAGCDMDSAEVSELIGVSIHAPLAGCDTCAIPHVR